jgi:hypothetical protein
MILITAPVFGDLMSLNEQLPEVVRMAMGATVSRMRIELIFRRCWNLITPCGQHSTAGETARAPIERQTCSQSHTDSPVGFCAPGNGARGASVLHSNLCNDSTQKRILHRVFDAAVPRRPGCATFQS